MEHPIETSGRYVFKIKVVYQENLHLFMYTMHVIENASRSFSTGLAIIYLTAKHISCKCSKNHTKQSSHVAIYIDHLMLRASITNVSKSESLAAPFRHKHGFENTVVSSHYSLACTCLAAQLHAASRIAHACWSSHDYNTASSHALCRPSMRAAQQPVPYRRHRIHAIKRCNA